MHDWRYATPDASLGPAPGVGQGPRYLGLLRWLVGCAALAVNSCGQQGVLDPQGPIASAQLLLLLNSTAIMLVVVVPVILATLGFAWWYRSSNPRATRATDEGYEGRLEFVVWSIPALIVILLGRGHLDRFPPARSAGADPGECQAAPGRGRGARLEMAVYLPRSGHCGGQSAGGAGGDAGRVSSDLGDGDEFVLRAAARQPDLHDGRDDHPPEPARDHARRISRLFGECSAATALPICGLSPRRCRPAISTAGSRRSAARDRRSTMPPMPHWQSRA